MINFKLISNDFSVENITDEEEILKNVLYKALAGKLSFNGIIDNSIPVKDELFEIIINNFVSEFNDETIYDLRVTELKDDEIIFNENVFNISNIVVDIK